jgi:hypothetical protein
LAGRDRVDAAGRKPNGELNVPGESISTPSNGQVNSPSDPLLDAIATLASYMDWLYTDVLKNGTACDGRTRLKCALHMDDMLSLIFRISSMIHLDFTDYPLPKRTKRKG